MGSEMCIRDRDTFEPKFQGLPVNARQNFQGHQGNPEDGSGQVAGGKRLGFQFQCRVEDTTPSLEVAQPDRQLLSGCAAGPSVHHIHGIERGHMQGLVELDLHAAIRSGNRQHIAVAFVPRGIGDFGNDVSEGFAIGIETEVAGDGVGLDTEIPPVGQQVYGTLGALAVLDNNSICLLYTSDAADE